MLQLVKLRTAVGLSADARGASSPRHMIPSAAEPHSASPRNRARKISLGFWSAVVLATLCALRPGMTAGLDQTAEKNTGPGR